MKGKMLYSGRGREGRGVGGQERGREVRGEGGDDGRRKGGKEMVASK